jgi:hypothetical protein
MVVKNNRTGGKPENIEDMNIRDIADFMANYWFKEDVIDKTLDEWSDWFPDILNNIGGADIVEYLAEHYGIDIEYDGDENAITFGGKMFRFTSTYTWHRRIEAKFRFNALLTEEVTMQFNDTFALAQYVALNPNIRLLAWRKVDLPVDEQKSTCNRYTAWSIVHMMKER